jgi:glycosyltransferase involved in cell wall biosynthesis
MLEIAIDVAMAYIRMADDLQEWLTGKGVNAEVRTIFNERRKADSRIYIAPFHTIRNPDIFQLLRCDVKTVWITDNEGLPVFQNQQQLEHVNSLNLTVSPGSRFTERNLRRAGVILPVKVVPRTVNHEKIAKVQPFKSEIEYVIFIAPYYWGMKHQRKGIEDAYEAMRIVNRKYPDLMLHHVTTHYPEAVGIKIPKDANIYIDQKYGERKYEEIISLIKGAKMLIAPSHCEGWNLPALEAMACKTPLVYTDAPAQNEFAFGEKVPCYGVEQEMTRYGIFNELHLFHVEDLAQAILNVYENPAYARELAEKAYEKSLEYNQEKVFPEYLKLLA